MDKPACWIKSINAFKPPRSEERVQGTKFLAGAWGKAPNVTPVPPTREAIKNKNQEAKRNLIPLTRIEPLPRNPSPRTRPAGRLVRVVTPVPGCRVSLLVSMGVMGFLGDLGGEIEIFP